MQSFTAAEKKVTSDPYDFVIAGGGLAGCLLAERLSADGSKRVLLLEAGSSDYTNKFIRIPAGVLRLFRSVYDWQFESSGEKHCNGRNIFLQRGKVNLKWDHDLLMWMVDSHVHRLLEVLLVRMYAFTIVVLLKITTTGKSLVGKRLTCSHSSRRHKRMSQEDPPNFMARMASG